MTLNRTSQLSTPKHLLNTFNIGIGRIVSQFLNLAVIPIILSKISPSDYGSYSLFQIIALVFGVIMAMGISTVFMSQFNDYKEMEQGKEKLFGECLTSQFILGGILLLIGLFLVLRFSPFENSGLFYPILSILFVKEFIANHDLIINRWQILTEKYWQVSFNAVLRSLTYLIASVFFVIYLKIGILGLAIADLVAECMVLVINLLLNRKKIVFGFSKRILADIFHLGLPAAPDTFFYWVIVSTPLFFYKFVGSPEAAGFYALAWRIASPIDVLGNSLAAGSAKDFIKNNYNFSGLIKTYRFSLLLVLFSVFTLGVLSPLLISTFFSAEYYQTIEIIPIIFSGNFFLCLYYYEWIGLSGSKRTFGLSLASGVGSIAGIVFIVLAIHYSMGTLKIGGTAYLIALLGMWLVARAVRPGNHYGKIWVISLLFLSVIFLMVEINQLPTNNILFFLVKILSVIVVGAIFLLYELHSRAKDKGKFYYRDIPTYSLMKRLLAKGDNILDIGCSEGQFLQELDIASKYGVDKNFNLLRQGKIENPGIMFICADASALPFKTEIFDRISMIGITPYLQYAENVIHDISKHLGNNGILAISTASDHFFYRMINIHQFKSRIRFYNRKDIVEYVLNSGLSVTNQLEKGFLITPLLGIVYTFTSLIDRKLIRSKNIIGPIGRWSRWITNPIIEWEYNHLSNYGYQIFVTGQKKYE